MSCTNLVKYTHRDVLCVPNDICYLSRDFSKYVNATGYLKYHETSYQIKFERGSKCTF